MAQDVTTDNVDRPAMTGDDGVQISVISPSFNQVAYVRRTLDSVSAQQDVTLEHIIYDAGSKDGTRDVLKAHAKVYPNVSLYLEADRGQSDAINKGLSRAKGSIVTWLNTDDFYTSVKILSRVLRVFEINTAVDVLYAKGEFVDSNGEKIRETFINRIPKELTHEFVRSVGILQPATFFRRELLNRSGFIDEGFTCAFDYELWLRLIATGARFAYLDEVVTYATFHNEAKSSALRFRQLYESAEITRRYYGFASAEWLRRTAECEIVGKNGIVDAVASPNSSAGIAAVKTLVRQVSRSLYRRLNTTNEARLGLLSAPDHAAYIESRSVAKSCGILDDDYVIATTFDNNYVEQGVSLIASIHRYEPRCRSILIYDLNLTNENRDLLEELDNVLVLKYPSYVISSFHDVLSPKNYGYKCAAMYDAGRFVKNGGTVLWVDAGVCLLEPLNKIFGVIRRSEVFFINHDDKGNWPFFNGTFTHPRSAERMGATREELLAPHLCSCLVGYRREGKFQRLFDDAARYSLDREIVVWDKHPPQGQPDPTGVRPAPPNANLLRRWFTNRAEYVAATDEDAAEAFGYLGHRQDQSILSILAARYGAPLQSARRYCRSDDDSSTASKLNWDSGSVSDAYSKTDVIPAHIAGSATYHHRGTYRAHDGLRRQRPVSRTLVLLGNGPSLKGFDFNRLKAFDAIGMNAAYRYWDQIDWYPRYYICLDKVVGLSHQGEIERLVRDSRRNNIELFVLRRNLIERLPPELRMDDRILDFDTLKETLPLFSAMPITTGSHASLVGAMLGYEQMILLGVDCSYVERIKGAAEQGGTTLELTETPKENPNYFFDNYQVAGDKYNIPNPTPDLHINSWRAVAPVLTGRKISVWNGSQTSRVDAFPYRGFDDVEIEEMNYRNSLPFKTAYESLQGLAWSAAELPTESREDQSSRSESDESFSRSILCPREARATVDETAVVAHLLNDRIGSHHCMLDVGAHFGGSAAYFDKLGWRILCFEPDPSNRQRLNARFGKSPSISIDPRAVSDKPAKGLAFFTSAESTGISGLHAFRETHSQTTTVDATTVEEIVRDSKTTYLDFLKIDVEGFDFAVLRGVPWDKLKPDVIECEFEDAKTVPLGHTYRDVADFLVSKGYAVYLSEWHPIVRYGIRHDWCRVIKYPEQLLCPEAWGNILAFRKDPGIEALEEAFRACLDIKDPTAVAPAPAPEGPLATSSPTKAEGVVASAPTPEDPSASSTATRLEAAAAPAKESSSGSISYGGLDLAEDHVGAGGSYRHLNVRARDLRAGARAWSEFWFKFQMFGDGVLVELRPLEARPVLFRAGLSNWPSDSYGPYQRLRLDPKDDYVYGAISLADSLDPADREALLTFLAELPSLLAEALGNASEESRDIWREKSTIVSEFSARITTLSARAAKIDPAARLSVEAKSAQAGSSDEQIPAPRPEPVSSPDAQPTASQSRLATVAAAARATASGPKGPVTTAPSGSAKKPQPSPGAGNPKRPAGPGPGPTNPPPSPAGGMSFGGYLDWSRRAIARRLILSAAAALILAGLAFAAFAPGLAAQRATFLPLFLFSLACLGIICGTGYAGSLARRADQRASGGARAMRVELAKLIGETAASLKAQYASDTEARTKTIEQSIEKLGSRLSGSEASLRTFDQAVGALRRNLSAIDGESARRSALEALASEVALLRTALREGETKQANWGRKLGEQETRIAALGVLRLDIEELKRGLASAAGKQALLDRLGQELDAVRAALRAGEARLTAADRRAEERDVKLSALEALLSGLGALRQEIAGAAARQAAIGSDVASLRGAIQAGESRLAAADRRAKERDAKLSALEALLSELGALRQEIAGAAARQAALGDDVASLHDAVQAGESKRADADRKADERDVRLSALEGLLSEITELRQGLSGTAARLDELFGGVSDLTERDLESAARIEAVGSELSGLGSRIEELSAFSKAMEARLSVGFASKEQVARLRDELNHSLEAQGASVASFNPRLEELRETLESTGAVQRASADRLIQLEILISAVGAISDELTQLRADTDSQIAAFESVQPDLEGLKSKASAQDAARQEFARQIANLQASLASLAPKASAQDAAQQEIVRQIANLQASLASLAPKATLETLRRDLTTQADRINDLDPALARLAVLDKVTDSIAEMQRLLGDHSDELQGLKPGFASLAVQTAKLRVAEQAIGKIATETEALSRDLEATRTEQTGLQKEVKAASARQSESDRALEKIANEAAKLRAELGAFNQRYGGLDEVTGKLKDGQYEMETRLRGLTEHLDTIVQNLAKIAQESSEAKSTAEKAEGTGRALMASSPSLNFGRYRVFNRQLSNVQIDRLKTAWARWLSVPATAQTLGYAAHRICTLESQMYGRLATSIEDIMLRTMVAQAVKSPHVEILEIGTLFGIGAISMADCLRREGKSVHVTLVDPLEGYYGLDARDIVTGQPVSESVLLENLRMAGIDRSHVALIKHLSTSDEALAAARQREYDVLVVDGDHSYAGVKADFENYLGLVRLGGYIVFDDYGADDWPDIKRYVDEEMPAHSEVAPVGSDWRTAVYRVVKRPEKPRRPTPRTPRRKGSRSAR